MGLKITIPVTNNSEPQFMEGLGGFTPGEPFVISDAQAEEFKTLHEMTVVQFGKAGKWDVEKADDPKPATTPEENMSEAAENAEAATEEEGDK